ncbi:hypothetical protein [Brevibacillus sp. SIMBA_040]|uniref:hypothetical protein n=1 Tax=unclassified Brevibacillus TaxID=2684853 RepID=UPI00397AB55A
MSQAKEIKRDNKPSGTFAGWFLLYPASGETGEIAAHLCEFKARPLALCSAGIARDLVDEGGDLYVTLKRSLCPIWWISESIIVLHCLKKVGVYRY